MTTQTHSEVHTGLMAVNFQFSNYTMNTFSYKNKRRELVLTENAFHMLNKNRKF